MTTLGTTRQAVINGILAGKSRQQLARELGLTLAGVDYHVYGIIRTNEVDPARLAAWRAAQRGLNTATKTEDKTAGPAGPAGQPGAPDPKALPCAACIHQPVCRLAEERRRAYAALGAAARNVPAGLVVEYRVRCEHAEAAAEKSRLTTRGAA